MSKAPEPYFPLSTGIIAAKTDAHHDFKSLYDESSVNAELPSHQGLPYMSEDAFLTTYTVNNINDIKIPQSEPTGPMTSITSNILKDDLKKEYTIVAYRNNKQSEDDESPPPEEGSNIQGSVLQEIVNKLGIENDIYIICDVAFSWIRYDLAKINKDKDQIFWWTQTTQTGFDPASKTGWHTGKELGFRNPWSQGGARFCWQSITKTDKPNKLYLPWPNNKTTIGLEDENAMLCLNKKLLMVARSENNKNWDYKSHNSYLLVYDSRTKKYVYATKDMAAKNYEMSKGMIASYENFGAKLIEMFKQMLLGGNQIPSLETYTLQYQMLAKRCGDMPQALECLNSTMRLQTLVDPTKKPSAVNVGVPVNFGNDRKVLYPGENGVDGIFESNGNNMFVSYDRIAVAQALNYRVPLVMYDQPFGMVIFVNNRLLSDSKKLVNALKEASAQDTSSKVTFGVEEKFYFKYGTTKGMDFITEKVNEFGSNLQYLVGGVEFVNNIRNELMNTLYNMPVTSDEELRAYLSAYFANLAKLELLNNIFDRMNQLEQYIANANQEFVVLTNVENPLVLILNNQLNISDVQTAVNNVFDEYSGVFEEVLNNEGVSVARNENTSATDFLSKLSGIVGYVINVINTVGTLKEEYDTLKQLSGVEATVPKGIAGNIASIAPSVVVDKRLTRHDPEQRVFGLAEKIFQHEKVITPIWTVVGKLDDNIFTLPDDFKIKMIGYVSAVMANPNVMNAKMYRMVVKKAIDDLNKLFASSASQLGGNQGDDIDNENQPMSPAIEQSQIEESSPQTQAPEPGLVAASSGKAQTDVTGLMNWVLSGNYYLSEEQVYNALNFDVLLKNVFNILSFHNLYQLLNGKGQSEYVAYDLYKQIGSYLQIMEFESKEPNVPMAPPSPEITDNMFLFNALENQVYASDITYNYGGQTYNFATILYYYLNQTSNKGVVLYPELNDVVLGFGSVMDEVFGSVMDEVFGKLASVDYGKFRQFIGQIFGEESIQIAPAYEETKIQQASRIPGQTMKRRRAMEMLSPPSERRSTMKRGREDISYESPLSMEENIPSKRMAVASGGKAKAKKGRKVRKNKKNAKITRKKHQTKGGKKMKSTLCKRRVGGKKQTKKHKKIAKHKRKQKTINRRKVMKHRR